MLFALVPGVSAQSITLPYKLPELERRAAQDSCDAVTQYQLGLGYWNEKRWDDAERALRRAVQVEPRYPHAWLALAWLMYARRPKLWKQQMKKGLPDSLVAVIQESERLQRRAFLIDPLVDLKVMSTVVPHEGGRRVTYGNYVLVLSNPFDAFRDGNYSVAYSLLQNLIYRYSADSVPPFVLWYAALSGAHLGYYDAAISDLAALVLRAEHLEQSDTVLHVPLRTNDYRYVLALLELDNNKPADAITLFHKVIENDVGFYMAHVKLAQMYDAYGMWKEATAEGRLAVEANPDDPSLLTELGVILRQADSLSESEAVLRQALDANPHDPRPPYYLGLTELQMGRTTEARAAFVHFLAMAPSRYASQITEVQGYLAKLQ
ncbi:MAG TPA: tetratricopeptide repeat protein [Candidatus Acidoferrum sp.]|nr:tetratricopeptide repeat protein [Candidatus Acidoferrum sp.]